MWNVTKRWFSSLPNSISETLPINFWSVRLVNFALDCPVVALGTELAFSTLTTCPASVPKYNVEESVVCGETVKADTFEVKNVA